MRLEKVEPTRKLSFSENLLSIEEFFLPPEMLKIRNGKKYVDWQAATQAAVMFMAGKMLELVSYNAVSHKQQKKKTMKLL